MHNNILQSIAGECGFAREVVEGLLTWAYQRGAKRSYLQVVLDNKAVLHMYNKLGFRKIYHYWYRIGA
ncbi:MAG: GNAT family N-acetyltransferase [Gammaproteobacteria bacterium]|nr:GNAT family N-acetyltransferase [Gammaproteobacteria bacterium]